MITRSLGDKHLFKKKYEITRATVIQQKILSRSGDRHWFTDEVELFPISSEEGTLEELCSENRCEHLGNF